VIASSRMCKTIAIFGDVHGHQDLMVREALRWQEEHQASIDLILCVGDLPPSAWNSQWRSAQI